MSYYNTTNEKKELLETFWAKSKKQEEFIYNLFVEYGEMTASDAYRHYLVINRTTPLTSIRRAITDLMNEGKLYKTDKKKKGLFGRPEYFYRLVFNEQLF